MRRAVAATTRAAVRSVLATRHAHTNLLVVDWTAYTERSWRPAGPGVWTRATQDRGASFLGASRRSGTCWSTTVAPLSASRLRTSGSPAAGASRTSGRKTRLVDPRARPGGSRCLPRCNRAGADYKPLLGRPRPEPACAGSAPAALSVGVRGAPPLSQLPCRLVGNWHPARRRTLGALDNRRRPLPCHAPRGAADGRHRRHPAPR